MSSTVTFTRVGNDEARIHQDGEHVGDLFRHPDILEPGECYFVIHLSEDPEAPFACTSVRASAR